MDAHLEKEWAALRQVRERNRIGIWGFGNVSRDVVLYLVEAGLGKEIVFYGRPKGSHTNRAGLWIDDLRANTFHGPRMMGTNRLEDMAGLDVLFVGVGVPRRPGQTRRDLLEDNTRVVADTCMEIRELYRNCAESDLPVLILMGNPVTTMTWVAYKITGFPKSHVMGQAGNLDSRRICHAVALELGLSGNDMRGIVFGDHGDSMVVSPRYFSVGGVPLDVFLHGAGKDLEMIRDVIEDAKKGGTHFVNEVGQSASAGPAKAAGSMLRCLITGQAEVQPVVCIVEREYALLNKEDGLDCMGFGVPARIGSHGVEAVYELPVDDVREELLNSAALVKEDIRNAAETLRKEYGIQA